MKKESRLEPPNPVPPKDDITTKKVDSKEVIVVPLNINVKDVALNMIKPDIQTNVSVIKSDNKSREVKIDVKAKIDNTLKEKNDSNDIKKQNLMETIKRHEKEQREIVQEQQEILKEMKKTKKEMEDENLLKKLEDGSLTNIENKKLAVENIQKLAKLAIESLGGKLDLVTEKSVNAQSTKTSNEPPPKVKQIDQVERAPEEVEPPKLLESHVHKEDEPLSYKTGEDAELVKNTISETKQTERANIMKKPPIPVYVLNQAKKDAEKAQVEANQADKNSIEDNYVGGKRDILEARLGDSKSAMLNDRHRRDVSDCADELNPDITLGLKLSLTLSEPETKLSEKPADEMNESSIDFIKHQLRHLQWRKEDMEKR